MTYRSFLAAAMLCLAASTLSAQEIIRVGIVGCDTSHAVAFTKLINDPAATGPRAKIEVVAAFPGGSADIPSSIDRVPEYVEQLRAMNVKIVDSIPELVEQCDAFLLESVDGRPHLEQFKQIAVGKPVFVDKPAAAELADVIALFRVAKETKTPCFSSSALRYCEAVAGLGNDAAIGPIDGCSVAGPYETEPHHIDLAWYGIHGVESIFTLMNTGCEAVGRVDGESAIVVTGRWNDGRLATFRGLKGRSEFTFTAFGKKAIAFREGFSGYGPLVEKICEFFISREAPVTPDETIEIFAFMEAADESHRRDGALVTTKEVLERAEKKLAAPTP